MKKLMMMALVACAAIAANATTVKWGTGKLYTAKDATGAFSDVVIGTAATVNFYVLSDTQYAAYSEDMSTLYADATGNKLGTAAKTANTSSMGSAYTWSDTVDQDTTKNIAMIVTYKDTTLDKDFYIANIATATPKSASQMTIGNLASDFGTWTAVPEPTSGLLLLLGMAGLALRRRRA